MIGSIEQPIPTVVGLLTLGIRPQDFIPGAYIQFLRIAGKEFPGDVVDEAKFTGPIARQLARRRLDHEVSALAVPRVRPACGGHEADRLSDATARRTATPTGTGL